MKGIPFPLLLAVMVAFLELCYFFWLREKYRMDGFQRARLFQRLAGYHYLKVSCEKLPEYPSSFLPSGEPVRGVSHEVILGILKKVEAKNGVLATVSGVALTGFLVIFQDVETRVGWLVPSLFVIISPAFFFLIYGTRQLDQLDFRDHSSTVHAAQALQEDLVIDLLRKEFFFRFCSDLVRLFIVVVLAAVVLVPVFPDAFGGAFAIPKPDVGCDL